MTNFKLKPFRPSQFTSSVEGEFSSVFNTQKKLHEIQITFLLNCSPEDIVWPEIQTGHPPARQDDLWLSTCFEFFLSYKGRAQYFEFNFSPSGHWQAYQFSRYREDRQVAPNLSLSKSEINHKANQTRVSIEVEYVEGDFVTNTSSKNILNLGLSVILLDKRRHYHYFALKHSSKEKADFHDPITHLLNINPVR
ncbi:MAG: hypothetical protein ACI9FB_004406 [Candidatus Azotimanducaceae bacterium]|jgi:hypothetical protein